MTICLYRAMLAALFFMSCAGNVSGEEKARKARVDGETMDRSRTVRGQELIGDLEQFRTILKTEWMLSNLGNPAFDSAIDAIGRDADEGMTLADLALRLQKVLALGQDGHMGGLEWAWGEIEGTRAGFTIDVCGDKYIAYLTEHLPHGPVNPKKTYRFRPLREGFPYLLAIDGVPIERWVEAASGFVPKGPPLAVRWASMMPLNYLPFMRRELGLPERADIRITLGSTDGQEQIDMHGPTGTDNLKPLLHVPQPDWRIIDERIGYIWLPHMYGKTTQLLMEAMPKLRDTQGLVLDLRGNRGGGTEPLLVVGSYLLSPHNPRVVIGQKFKWQGDPWKRTSLPHSGTEGLSDHGKQLLTRFKPRFHPCWQPPPHRLVDARCLFIARAEAEPAVHPFCHEGWPEESFHYAKPVVLLFDHRTYSAGEIFVSGIGSLPNVTLVGASSSAAAGGTPSNYTLDKSKLTFYLVDSVHVRVDGLPIGGFGIEPDVLVEPDPDYYFGTRDRMLETAIEVLQQKGD